LGWGIERIQFLFRRAIALLKQKCVVVDIQKKESNFVTHENKEEVDDGDIAPHLLVVVPTNLSSQGRGNEQKNVSCEIITTAENNPQIEEVISRLRNWIRAMEDQNDEF
jgi:hypothetical protein